MKTTRVIFEHILNDNGKSLKEKLKSEDLEGIDDIFEIWLKSKTMRFYGTWMRKEYSIEFNRRYKQWRINGINDDKLVDAIKRDAWNDMAVLRQRRYDNLK
jgi:hypothetical protein